MKNYISQYKVLFGLSWIFLYLIFPVWISKHLVFEQWGVAGLNYTLARAFIILGLTVFFAFAAYIMNLCFKDAIADSPVINIDGSWFVNVKNNLSLVIVCGVALLLHIYMFSPIIVLCEVRSLSQTFWMYDVLNNFCQRTFGISMQYLFWTVSALMVLVIRQKKLSGIIYDNFAKLFSVYSSSIMMKVFAVLFIFGLFDLYANLFPYFSWLEATQIIRYPPVSRFLYLTMYSAFGVSHTVSQVLQLIFYLLSGIYLYRLILLFHEKEAALLGVVIYLFSPIIFLYATIANLASGTVFFSIIISYHFLRFMKEENDRDIILTSFFLGIGFMYKRVILFMFVVCFVYLLFSKVMKRDWRLSKDIKILLLSLLTIVPWLKLGKLHTFGLVWSHFSSLDGVSIIPKMLYSQISPVIFMLLIWALCSLFIKRNHLSLFFVLLIATYYTLFTLMSAGEFNHRYLMIAYPGIAVLLAQMLYGILQKIRWKHTFKVLFSVVAIYMIVLCVVPRSSLSLVTYKYKDFESQHYPVDQATDWLRDNAGKKEKVQVFYMIPYKFYLERVYKDNKIIYPERFSFRDAGSDAKAVIYPLQKLIDYCRTENISYVMFPYGPRNSLPNARPFIELMEMTKYLREQMGKSFIEVAKFSIDDNYIFIYKIK